jgi:hypothetical protein
MSLNGIRDQVGDLEVQTYPKSGFPWQKDNVGQRRRFPWEKPSEFTAVSSSLGMAFASSTKDKPVSALMFYCEPHPIVGSNTVFRGRISGGLSFADRRKVTRSEVVAVFGEPSTNEANLPRAMRLTQAGVSVSSRSETDKGVEYLFYASNGIQFVLEQDVVTVIRILPKVQPRQGATGP